MTQPALPTKEYELLELLDRIETLIEDMEDLGVRSRDEAEALMASVHERLDSLERASK
jgi:hypothetical protein